MSLAFYRRYLTLVDEIERSFPVMYWKKGDVDIWPLARLDLYLDMYWDQVGDVPPAPRVFPLRLAGRCARPLINLWRSRGDLAHFVMWPKPAHAILLGDGVSLDRMDGAWQDRFGEPLIAALEKQGRTTFLMQSGNLSRLPWRRPTYAASIIEAWGQLTSFAERSPYELPDHDRVLRFLAGNGVSAPSLERVALARRAAAVSATAAEFESVLRIVKPKLAFVVTSFAGLGPAFVLSCRRQGILSVDLQRCPLDGAPMAYAWSALPDNGYTTLPALFWNWTEEDAANIQSWAGKLALPWHQSFHGGHTQLTAFADDNGPETVAWDAKFKRIVGDAAFEREILVALQPIGGHCADWEALAAQIDAAPATWRWWIRRHPASHTYQDAAFGRLLSLRRPNVMIDQASVLPLPVLLRHMSVMLSLASGAVVEAAMFGVPTLFLSDDSRGPFAELIARGKARVIDARNVNTAIALLPATSHRRMPVRQPALDETLRRLEAIAHDYAMLCRNNNRIGARAHD